MRLRTTALCLSLACASCAGQLDVPAGGPAEKPAPTAAAVSGSVRYAATAAKLPDPLEATALRRAAPIAPGDWIVCVRSRAPDRPPAYAVYFTDTYKDFRRAVAVDGCDKDQYSPFPPP